MPLYQKYNAKKREKRNIFLYGNLLWGGKCCSGEKLLGEVSGTRGMAMLLGGGKCCSGEKLLGGSCSGEMKLLGGGKCCSGGGNVTRGSQMLLGGSGI